MENSRFQNPPLIDSTVEFPRDSVHLIELLDQYFPPKCKQRWEPEEAHQRYAGVRELIDSLVAWKEEETGA